MLEKHKVALKIETYSISQTTLEQIFLSFAYDQINTDSSSSNNASKRNSVSRDAQLPIFSSIEPLDSDFHDHVRKTESNKFKIFKAKLNINI